MQKDPAGALIKNYGHKIKAFSFAPLCASCTLLPALLFQLKMNRREEDVTACSSALGNSMTWENEGGGCFPSRKPGPTKKYKIQSGESK